MIQDPKNKDSENEAHGITGSNNPNDDEEILKNTDEPLTEEDDEIPNKVEERKTNNRKN
jgi:hypothetical protein